MDLATKFKAVTAWQNIGSIHPFTCGVNSVHKKLTPEIDDEEGKIYLRCIDCGYSQEDVPEIIYEWYLTIKGIKKYCTIFNRECMESDCHYDNNYDKRYCQHCYDIE